MSKSLLYVFVLFFFKFRLEWTCWPFRALHQSNVLVLTLAIFIYIHTVKLFYPFLLKTAFPLLFILLLPLFSTFCLLGGLWFGLSLTFVTARKLEGRYIMLRDWRYTGGNKLCCVMLRVMPMLYASGDDVFRICDDQSIEWWTYGLNGWNGNAFVILCGK